MKREETGEVRKKKKETDFQSLAWSEILIVVVTISIAKTGHIGT